MKVFYRISDKGNPKEKIPQADKFSCLENAVKSFDKDNVYVIADNCNSDTIQFIKNTGLKYEETSLGNSGSFRYMVEQIIKTIPENESVYLLEDDYIHLPGSARLLNEGLEIADYVTLYDHPDKYVLSKDGGNPFNFKTLHPTQLFITKGSHWALINSTTMTFACKVKTLKEDFPVWIKYLDSRNPKDFRAFLELTQASPSDAWEFLRQNKKRNFRIIMRNYFSRKKMRKVISSIPAHATHAEVKFLAPVIDWTRGTK